MNAYYVFVKFAKLWELSAEGPARDKQMPRDPRVP
jgi:hypothetical protein